MTLHATPAWSIDGGLAMLTFTQFDATTIEVVCDGACAGATVTVPPGDDNVSGTNGAEICGGDYVVSEV